MDGVHDLGGVQGFGPVDLEASEPTFHADWERKAFGLAVALMATGQVRGFRHAIERMDPVWYLTSPYYEHWLAAATAGVVEGGLVTLEELDRRLGSPFPLPRP